MTHKNNLSLINRALLLIIGIWIHTMGIALITQASLGTTPISTSPLVLSKIIGISFGAMTFLVNAVFFILECIILKKCNAKLLAQIPNVAIFSLSINFSMFLVGLIPCETLYSQIVMSLLGNVVLALGIVLQLKSDTLLQPGEGLVYAIVLKTSANFGNVKIASDVSCVAVAATCGYVFLSQFYGLGLMTLISAFMVGSCVKAFKPLFRI